jgi:hypothetical protein
METSITPSLVEPGVKYFINCTLKQCREVKDKYINLLFNVGVFVVLVVAIFGVLAYRYRGRQTPAEVEIKNRKKQEYIIQKLQQISDIKRKASEVMITDLPNWNDHPELGILNRYNSVGVNPFKQ